MLDAGLLPAEDEVDRLEAAGLAVGPPRVAAEVDVGPDTPTTVRGGPGARNDAGVPDVGV